MILEQILSWVVGAVGITGFFLAGKRIWWAWYVNIGCQAIWVAFAIVSNTPAFLITALFYTIVFSKNAHHWTKDHLTIKRLLEEERVRKIQDLLEDSAVVESDYVQKQRLRAQRSAIYGRKQQRRWPDSMDSI